MRTLASVAAASAVLGLFHSDGSFGQTVPARPGLKVEVSIDRKGSGTGPLSAGEFLSVSIAYSDAQTGEPAKGLAPRAFIRRLGPGVPSCGQAAHMVRASGVLGSGDYALDGRYFVGLTREAGTYRVSVTDLAHRVGVANTISVTELRSAPDRMVVDARTGVALLVDRDMGTIDAVDVPSGGVRDFAKGLAKPGQVVVMGDGSVAIAEDGGGTVALLDPDGSRRRTIAVGSAPLRLLAAGNGGLLTSSATGSGILIRTPDADPIQFPSGSFPAPLDANPEMIVSASPQAGLEVRWLDAPREVSRVALPFSPAGLALLASAGRSYAVAWSDDDRPTAVAVDLATFRVTDPLTLPMPVIETAAAGSAVVLSHRGSGMLSVLDLGPMAKGGSPFLRRVDVDAPGSNDDDGDREATRLVSLSPDPMALYVPPKSDRAFRVSAGGGLSNAAAGSTRIQGGEVRSVAMLDRGLVETSPGRFSALVSLPEGGPFQIVATTGPGGTTGCAGFRLEGPGADEAPPAVLSIVSIEPPERPGQATRLVLAVRHPPADLPAGPLALRLHSLSFGAPRLVSAAPRPDGTFELDLREQRPGRFSLSVDEAAPQIAPAVFDVTKKEAP